MRLNEGGGEAFSSITLCNVVSSSTFDEGFLMRINVAGMVAAGALISIGCGGHGSSSTVAAPTAPSVPAAQPPTVNVSTIAPAGWNGQSSADQVGSSGFGLTVTQTGAQFTGSIGMLGHSGSVAGTVSGNTISFNFTQTGNQSQQCGSLSGTATVSSTNTMTSSGSNTTNSMSGTFSGKDCAGNPITNGTFSGSPVMVYLSATRFPVTGTWTGFLPPQLGGGTWTWVLAQGGDVSGGNVTGSVTFGTGNTLNLGTGTVTGMVTNIFPGPPQAMTAVTTVSFTGACPATLTANWAYAGWSPGPPGTINVGGQSGLQLQPSSYSGSSCNGPFPQGPPPIGILQRQ